MACLMASEPQPPSWQGVCSGEGRESVRTLRMSTMRGGKGVWESGNGHTTYRRAQLQVEAAHGRPVVHGVEGGDLVHAHGRHLEELRDGVHDADAGEAVLALAKVEQRHHGRLLVLRRVALEDLGDELLVDGVELERDGRVVVGGVAVLELEGGECQQRSLVMVVGNWVVVLRLGGRCLPRGRWCLWVGGKGGGSFSRYGRGSGRRRGGIWRPWWRGCGDGREVQTRETAIEDRHSRMLRNSKGSDWRMVFTLAGLAV